MSDNGRTLNREPYVSRLDLAQTVTGTISGIVTDTNGAAVPGASVTLVGDLKGDARTLTTNDAGRFSFTAVQPGAYVVRIEQKGFQTLEQKSVVLSANENLALGDLSEMVTVTSVGPRLYLLTSMHGALRRFYNYPRPRPEQARTS